MALTHVNIVIKARYLILQRSKRTTIH